MCFYRYARVLVCKGPPLYHLPMILFIFLISGMLTFLESLYEACADGDIFTPGHLQTLTSTHHYIYTPTHLQTETSTDRDIYKIRQLFAQLFSIVGTILRAYSIGKNSRRVLMPRVDITTPTMARIIRIILK